MLVILGATGDLCKTKIFPSINAVLRTELSLCMGGAYAAEELSNTEGTLSSSVSTQDLHKSPITHAYPADGRKYVHYLQAEEGKIERKDIKQHSILQNTGVRIPSIIGYGRSRLTTAEFIRRIDPSINFLKETVENISYVHGAYEDCLSTLQKHFDEERPKKVFLYLAVPPEVYPTILSQVKEAKDLNIVVLMEKPQGTSLASFQSLQREMQGMSSHVFCVDHYLFKNVVLQLPSLLKTGPLKDLLVPSTVSEIHGSFNETMGVEERLGYFSTAGTCRDVLQNHVLQCLGVLLSRGESKLSVLQSLSSLEPKSTVVGEYRYYRRLLKKQGLTMAPAETYISTSTHVGGEWNKKVTIECGKKMKAHFVGFLVKLNALGVERVKKYPCTEKDFENEKKISRVPEEEMQAQIRVEITPKDCVYIELKHKRTLLKRIHVPVERAPHGASPYQRLFTQIILDGEVQENFALPEEVEQQWRVVDAVLDNSNIKRIRY
ncbi:glucose-6-phosphate 1-dehydrogenase [Nematocida sp. AWRm77]|nr:glucose-6-phosphate 1-dehydrogenase [Nematocida sp. AWRm77]